MDPLAELDSLIERWRHEIADNSSADPVPLLTSIAELIERETEVYLKLPIDPFDDRHPSRTYPECTLGQLLKALFKNESFMSQLTSDYTSSRGNFDLYVIKCRLLLDILPGLDTTVVFKELKETLVKQLLEWAEKAEFPLHSYATGLLGAAMTIPELSDLYRVKNNQIVPLMLNRLNQIAKTSSENMNSRNCVETSDTQQSHLNNSKQKINSGAKRPHAELDHDEETLESKPSSNDINGKKLKKVTSIKTQTKSPIHNECSSSSWAEAYMSGSYQMHPLSVVMQQRFILQYLSALGEYQESLDYMFEYKALTYIIDFIDGRKNQDIRLAFDALRFLAALLKHKKFALEFLDHDGLAELLRVNRHGMASAGVSLCLLRLACNEDVMEKICWMEKEREEVVENMVSYGLWLLECSHDSGKAHAATFFSLCFQFPILLKLFDRDNGIRKLLNVISMRGLFLDDPGLQELTDDEMFIRRQTAKQVCIAMKKYTRAHFISETRKHNRTNLQPFEQEYKATNISDEHVMDAIELHRQQSIQRFNWRTIDKIVQEDGVNYLLKIIITICTDFSELNTGNSETVRNALEVLVVCSLSPRVQQLLLKEMVHPNGSYSLDHPALSVIVMCADPKILRCQKPALNILINLVCSSQQARVAAPIMNASLDASLDVSRGTPGSARKKAIAKNSIDLSVALRRAVWANNGSLVLPKLLTNTSPPVEADAIRSLACRVLCGLAKEENIRKIISKLPLFTDGQLQSLMKEPILPEKRIEHTSFCKYCRELIEKVTGAPVTSSGVEASLEEIKRLKVVEQTQIDYNEDEVYQLMYNYLNSKGKSDVAAALYKAANLSDISQSTVTLDTIVTQYFRHQHSLCKNPVATCPPFKLSEPHRCPEPTNRLLAPLNITSRILRRKVCPPYGGINGAKFNRRYVYSKFRPVKLVRDPEDLRPSSTCCAFSNDGQFLFVGTDHGELKAFNISTSEVAATYDCHLNELGYIEASRDDSLIITTSPDAPTPQSILWTFTDVFERKHRFDGDYHAEFGKASSDRIITTQEMYARLWDTATGALLNKFEGLHHFTCNRATLNYCDTLVLNDGVLWDVRSTQPVHKFDKFNERINGLFHPNGNEIICNTCVWDIRNFGLLRTVQAFDMCQLKFNSTGDVIFSTIMDDQLESNANKLKNEFRTSFRTFDSHDYSTIATIDLKRTITHLAVSSGDEYIALVESTSGNPRYLPDDYQAESSICRMYEIGRPRYDADICLADEEGEEDDEDDEDDDDEDDDDEEGEVLDYDEEFLDDDVYGDMTDDTGDEEDVIDDDEDMSESHLSSSANSSSPRSRNDEIVPFFFRSRSSDAEDDDDGSATSTDEDL